MLNILRNPDGIDHRNGAISKLSEFFCEPYGKVMVNEPSGQAFPGIVPRMGRPFFHNSYSRYPFHHSMRPHSHPVPLGLILKNRIFQRSKHGFTDKRRP